MSQIYFRVQTLSIVFLSNANCFLVRVYFDFQDIVQYLSCFSLACTLTVRSVTLWFTGSSEFDSINNGDQ
ncbi:hypothetical protein VNO80_07409 [Phaseolus coccineus]|uniref:Uncharacterized protein n=1 Tax=Phaseolus coccineus TaxID=3886 RepID=A0AAN9RIG9_PHACN